jgi:hypothetical protein
MSVVYHQKDGLLKATLLIYAMSKGRGYRTRRFLELLWLVCSLYDEEQHGSDLRLCPWTNCSAVLDSASWHTRDLATVVCWAGGAPHG